MKLAKDLGLLHIFCIAAGAMISSGIFILPGLAHAKAGPAVVFSYLLAGLLATAGLLSIIELTTAMPKAGSDYFYISRGMGTAAGTISGLLSWFSLAVKSSFALIGIAVLCSPYIPLNWHTIAAILCLFFVAVNLRGIKGAARVQVVFVLVLLGIIITFVVKGASNVNMQHFEDFVPHGWRAVISTTGFVFVSYGGLIKIASIAGEVKDPGKTIPRGMILALVAMVILYTMMIFVTSGVLEANILNESMTPISDAAEVFWGTPGFVIISIAAGLAFVTTANAGIMTASRYLLALSKDELLPKPLSRVSKKFQTPYIAVIITGFVILLLIFINLYVLAEAASTVFILSYILASLSVVILRESGLQNYRPKFCAPFYPWLQIGTIVGFAFVIFEMGENAFLTTAVMVLIGFGFYWIYGRKRAAKESALMHLVEKITSKELVTGSLDSELKQIIRERDEIISDKFDELVENSVVLDIEEPMELDDFFDTVSEWMAPKLSEDKGKLKNFLLERESKSSTVLSPSLAVPHIVIEGSDKFDMLISRARKGINFSEQAPHIKTVFVLVGTKDLRNFHLRVLSAIAQIVQTPNFEKDWDTAQNKQALKDILLLAKRNRL